MERVPEPPPFDLEFFEDEDGREPVLDWLRSLSPVKRRAMGVALQEILQYEGPAVVDGNFGRTLGGGLFEFRLDQDAAQILRRKRKPFRAEPGSEKILLRVFCHAHGSRIVLLLGGYDKGEHTSARHQQREIALPRQRLRRWKEWQAAR